MKPISWWTVGDSCRTDGKTEPANGRRTEHGHRQEIEIEPRTTCKPAQIEAASTMPSSAAASASASAATASASASASASMKGSSKPSTFRPTNQLLTADFTAATQIVDGKPKGQNASGRNWKLRPQKRASTIVTKVSTNNRSKPWDKRRAEREARKAAKERETELRDEMRQAAIAKKERRLENERRRAENEFNNAQKFAQNLGRNADTKMKAMSKKQLRQIKKTRMNSKTGVVEYVSPYAK